MGRVEAVPQAVPHALDCDDQAQLSLTLPPSPSLLTIGIDPGGPGAVLVEIREAGQDLTISDDGEFERRTVNTPPRHGVEVLRIDAPLTLTIDRLRSGRGQGAVELWLHCDRAQADTLWRWLETADAISRLFTGGVGSLAEAYPEAQLQQLKVDAFDARTEALAIHLQAQALLLAGRSAEAGPAFMAAGDAWQRSGDTVRAAVARVGAVEDLNRSGRYRETIALARPDGTAPDGSHYFGARLENARCLALHYLGQLQPAADCYAWTAARFEALGETLEVAVTAVDFAAVERSLGRFDDARALALQSLDIAEGPQSIPVQGRAHFMLADLAIRSGDVAEALTRLQQAQERFATSGELRWEAGMLTRLAGLLGDLGAWGDARLAGVRALALLDPRHAAGPHANAQVAMARIDLAEQRFDEGLARIDAALAVFRELSMPEELAIAEIEGLRLLVAAKDARAADAYAQSPTDAPQVAQRRALAEAELALASGRIEDAGRRLSKVDPERLSLRDRLRFRRGVALIDARSGRRAAAFATLRSEAAALARIAEAAGSGVLATALRQSIRELRGTAIELIAETSSNADDARAATAELAAWAALTVPQRHRIERGSGGFGQRIDRAMGSVLLAGQSAAKEASGGEGWRALLELLAERGSRPAEPQALPPMEFMQALAADGPLLMLLGGETRALVAYVDGPRIELRMLGDLPMLRQQIAALDQVTRTPTGSVREIAEQSRVLSEALLGPLAGVSRPAILRVLNDGLGAAVPWPLLHWPGDDMPIAEHVPVSFVEPASGAHGQGVWAATIDVLQAAQSASAAAASGLPMLQSIGTEADLIRAHAGKRGVRLGHAADREAVLAALQTTGAWVHISAHGALRPGLLAGSGLWLDPGEGGVPQYLSWIDFAERGAAAELLVLNACQLAASDPAATTASMAFASALSRAGVRHVVAARWPVSDTASQHWVPAFYAAATAGERPDPASALWQAQRALRASRAFRHPFHWAGWVHIERIGGTGRALLEAAP